MTRPFYLLGLDPGLKNFGWAMVEKGDGYIKVDSMGWFGSDKSDKKLNVRAAADDFTRWQHVVKNLDGLFPKAHAVTAEAMSFVRNASTMAQIGGSWGVVATLCEIYEHPLVSVTPQEIKKHLCSARDASKQEVQTALDEHFGACLGEVHLKGLPKGKWEHPYDALGSILCGLDSDVVRAAQKAAAA